VCALDEGDDPLEDPSCWVKANPLLGVTITEEYLAEVVAQAKAIPGQLNGILRLHFCVWTDAETAWMTRATLEPCLAEFDIDEHEGADIWLGLDLSQNRDITALGAVVRTGTDDAGKPLFDAWVEAWTPGDTLMARERRDRVPYAVWVREGHLHAPPGENINYRHVAQTLAEYAERFYVQLVAYDRYAFRRFEEDVDELGLALSFAEHPQGGTKKGKSLTSGGEGLWMPGSVSVLEEALLERRVRLKRNPVLISALMSAVAEEDKWGNRWLAKRRSVNKIDAAVALAMAIGAATNAAETESYVDEELIAS
jgi:phage terminase large subunit-like protein